MASRRKTLYSTAATLAVGAAGYFLYTAFAVQGQGTLAQAPLNIQSSVTPAFIMAVDNSGSMSTDETLCRTGQGQCAWDADTLSFFDKNGVAFESADKSYLQAVDSGAPRPDVYGAIRDPEYNRAYFNPANVYKPWQKYDGTFEADSPVGKAVEDPRGGGTTFDFTTYKQDTFTFTSGMMLVKGTTYYNDQKCNREPGSSATVNDWVTLASDLDFTASCKTTYRYYPAVVYLSDAAPPPPGYNLAKREEVKNAGPKGISLWKYVYLEENFTTDGKEAVQNFANWWTYYGNRNRSMIAAMTQSMVDITNMRVGYFQINPAPPSGNVTMYDIGVPADKQSLYTKMRALDASGNTPTRRAVAYLGQQFRRKDKGAPIQLVCQKNAGMLFTDGYTNDTATPSPTVGDVDGGLKQPPFSGGVASSNTIADFAMNAYLNNLRPDMLAGKVPVPSGCSVATPDPRLDCQKDLHMNFYGVTLGARGAVYDVNAAATKDPYANPPAWGATGTMNLDPRNVDDIWHAALNTRGEFINAQSPAAITEAMRRILLQVGAGATPSGSIALTGSRIGTGSLTVVPFYESTNNGTDWYSTLTGATVTSDLISGAVTMKDKWEASAVLPDVRNIRFGTTASGVHPTVADFTAANLGAKPFATLCSNPLLSRCDEAKVTGLGVTADQAIAYLRGDTTHEVKKGGELRDRKTRLGDIVNSSPVISSPSMDDYGYATLRGSTPTDFNPYDYDLYVKNTKKTRPSMVYAGANDGMLHAFDGETGVERFAYIPATAVGHMGNLLFPYKTEDKNNQVFSHRYYVDGPIVVSDAYSSSGWTSTSGWNTVLVGTAGAGGRSVFALNVSNPSSFDNSGVLWEVNDKVSDTNIKNNIGYVLGKPVVVPVKIGTDIKWKAIFGNGFGSVNGVATLFVVDIASGAVEIRQAVEASAPATSNGLGNIIAIDRFQGSTATLSRDGYADTVYAGDQNGAVWKFDLRTATPTVALGGKPLFVAKDKDGNRQPIMGGFEAANGPLGGVMVYFGTGSFSFLNDPTDITMQSLYAVLDKDVALTGRSDLLQQKVTVDDTGVRTTTKASGLGKSGWYIDLGVSGSGDPVATGERFVGNPVIASGVVFFPTYDPNSTVDCGTNGNNWLYGLDALTGGAALNGARIGSPTGDSYGDGTGAVKLNVAGTAPVKDVAVMTTPRQGILPLDAKPEDVEKALAAKCSMVVQVPGSLEPLYLPRACGRQSWRQMQ